VSDGCGDMAMDLHTAAVNGNVVEVRRMVSAGADVNKPNQYGMRPLHVAALSGHVETVKTLVELGAELGVRTAGGETPLQLSVRLGHHQLAEVLRELERTVRGSGTLGVGAPQLPVGGGRILLAQCGVARIHHRCVWEPS
jgi:ankyrin repeat protein